MHVVGLLLAHGTRLDGLRQIFVDPVGRLLSSEEIGVSLLHGPLRFIGHLVLHQHQNTLVGVCLKSTQLLAWKLSRVVFRNLS